MLLLVSLFTAAFCFAREARPAELPRHPASADAPAANTDPTYVQLRQAKLESKALLVHEIVLRRDAGTFTLQSGKLYFVAAIAGKVTGAVLNDVLCAK